MPAILRSDVAKGYVRNIGKPSDVTPAKQASFIGIPQEIRQNIYKLLFNTPRLIITAWCEPQACLGTACFYTAILYTCRQVHQEARTTLSVQLELEVIFYHDAVFTQVPPQIQEFVLPYIRKINFNRHIFDGPLDWWRIISFLMQAPLLQNLHFGGTMMSNDLCIEDVYKAVTSTTTHWGPLRTRESISGCSSYNKFLLRNALQLHGLGPECTGGPLELDLKRTSINISMDQLRGQVTGTVKNFLRVTDYNSLEDYPLAGLPRRSSEKRQATIVRSPAKPMSPLSNLTLIDYYIQLRDSENCTSLCVSELGPESSDCP